jgi:iron complex outermembrane receptor protein
MKMMPYNSQIFLSLILRHAVALLILAGYAALFAQQDTLTIAAQDTLLTKSKPTLPDTSTVDKMVVTGTRTLRSIKDNPANVTVITREHIEAAPVNNVSDLLLYEPGVIVKRPVGMGEGVPSDICIRGVPGATAATRTLILVDGIPTNAAGTPFLILNEVPMDAIERIEIVRGPYSALYGPNAFSGVVNIITRNPEKGIHGSVSGGGFSNFYDAAVQVSGASGRFSFLVDGNARGIVNYYGTDSVRHEFGDSVRMTKADNYGYYDKRLFGKLSYAFSSRATLTLNARYFNSDLGFGKTELGDSSNVSTLGQKFLIGPVLKINVTPWFDIKAAGYFRNLTGTFYGQGVRPDTFFNTSGGIDSIRDNYVGSVWKSSSNDWQADAQSTFNFGKSNTLITGFDFLDNAIDFGPRRDPLRGDLLEKTDSTAVDSVSKAMQNFGLYLQDEAKFWNKLIVTGGIRLDYNSAFGFIPCPKVGFVYKPVTPLRLKLSAGRAFRSPSLGELYMPDMPINTGTTIRSEPGLKPETIWSLDGGPEIDIMKFGTIRITGFYNSMENLITQKVIDPGYEQILQGKAMLSHRNVTKAWSGGLESSFEVLLFGWGSYFFNYTFTKSEDVQLHGRLEYIPEHQFSSGIFLKKTFGSITVSGSVLENYVGERDYLDMQVTLQNIINKIIPMPETPSGFEPTYRTLPSYFRTDASVKVMYGRFVWISLEGMNLTNADIEEESGTFAPRRTVLLRLGISF